MDYRDLPYDAEIEYLEGSGTQYILTNIPNRSAFSMSIKFMLTSDASYEAIFGSVGNSPRPGFRLYRYNATTLYAQSGKFIDVKTTTASIKNVAITFSATANNGTLSISSTYGSLTTTDCDFTASGNWTIFTSRVNGGVSGIITGRIYSFTYSSSEQNVDLIPVRVGNVGYLFDRVSGQLFGNSGTGSFVLGPDVAPGRYANEVAFLESWGNQYIDTGIKPSTDTKIELKCLYCKSGAGLTNYGALIGADDRYTAYILNHSAVANFTYGLEFSNNFANPQTRLLTFDSTASPQNMRVYDEGGSLVTTLTCIRGVFEVSQNLYLFATNRSGTPVYGSNRILYCKIYDGKTLVRDYVPVEYNGIGYMYDKVSGLFFDNQGTGKFLFGSIAKACARSYTRRQLMMEGRKRLPYGYVELEYIQNTTGAWSTSAPYINTGLKPAADSTDGDTYSFEGAWSREGNLTSNFDGICAADSGGSTASTWSLYYSMKQVGTIQVKTNTKGAKFINLSNTATGVKHTFKMSSSSVTIDNTTTSAPTGKGSAITTNLLLFRRVPNGQGFPMKLYYFKVFKSGVLLMDLIPCKNRNNVVGMFDLVSKSFFGSANSGTFVAGKIIY